MGTAATFNNPSDISMDSAGNFYVADSGNNVIREITASEVVTTLAGTAGVTGASDGTGSAARFNSPQGVAVDSGGNVYTVGYEPSLINGITSSGTVSVLAGSSASGSADGTGTAASFNEPRGIAVDSAGNLFVADSENNTIRKITSAGVVTTLAGTAGIQGYADGVGSAAKFNYPTGVALDANDNVYVVDARNYVVRMITQAGVVTTVIGTPGMAGSQMGDYGLPGSNVSIALLNGVFYLTDNNGIITAPLP